MLCKSAGEIKHSVHVAAAAGEHPLRRNQSWSPGLYRRSLTQILSASVSDFRGGHGADVRICLVHSFTLETWNVFRTLQAATLA